MASAKVILTIDLNNEEMAILKKRAKKNLLSTREMAEDIIRRSCIRSMKKVYNEPNIDDKLVGIFSRQQRGRKRKKL